MPWAHIDVSKHDAQHQVNILQITYEDLERRHKLLEMRNEALERQLLENDRALGQKEFRAAIAQLAKYSHLQGAMKAVGAVFGDKLRELAAEVRKAATGTKSHDASAVEAIAALRADIARLEARTAAKAPAAKSVDLSKAKARAKAATGVRIPPDIVATVKHRGKPVRVDLAAAAKVQKQRTAKMRQVRV